MSIALAERPTAPPPPAEPLLDPEEALLVEDAAYWRDRHDRLFRHAFALETAFGRRLLRHNAGPGARCDCEECAWLRSLIDDDLAARILEEAITVTMPADFDAWAAQRADALAAQRRDAEDAIARARDQLASVQKEEKALGAARAAYGRAIGTAPPERTASPPPVRTAAAPGRTVEFARAWAAEHGGRLVLAEAVPILAEQRGVSATEAGNQLGQALRNTTHFERISRGVYAVKQGESEA